MSNLGNIEIRRVFPPFSESFIKELSDWEMRVFGSTPFIEGTKWRLTHMPDVSVFAAYDGSKLVGCKAGYASTNNRYLSWLGGVDPDYRQQGIAGRLMNAQHNWLASQRFQKVETHVAQSNAAMINLNLKAGLQIIGMFMKGERPFLIMSKELKEV